MSDPTMIDDGSEGMDRITEQRNALMAERDMLRKELEIAVDKWANFVPCAHCVRIRATNGEQAEYCQPYEPKACRKVISDWLTATVAKGERCTCGQGFDPVCPSRSHHNGKGEVQP